MSDAHPVFARVWPLLSGRVVPPRRRGELLARVSGRVVEIGAGDGSSFPYYGRDVSELVAVEPEPHLRELAEKQASSSRLAVTVRDGNAEALPLEDEAFDAVVSSLVLCSVRDQDGALGELRRVLRPGGRLYFYEHVVADHGVTAAFQRGLDASGVWPTLSGGCHLSRNTLARMGEAGFTIGTVRRFTSGPERVGVPFLLGTAERPA